MKHSEIYYHSKNDLAANICHNIQDKFGEVGVEEAYLTKMFHNLLYHDVLLPKGADQKFQDYKVLWETVLEKKNEAYDPYQALHLIIPLPSDVPPSGNIGLCQQIAKTHFVKRGFAVQADIHSEDELDSYVHAHLLVSPYSFSQNGQELGKWEDIGLMFPQRY